MRRVITVFLGVLFIFPLLLRPAAAGMDEMRVVEKIRGAVSVKRKSGKAAGVWTKAKEKEIIGPGDMVRTGKDGGVRLRLGAEATPTPSSRGIIEILLSNTMVRLRSQYVAYPKKLPLIQVLQGKTHPITEDY